jgi:glycine/serine hydroxymethyltransferase
MVEIADIFAQTIKNHTDETVLEAQKQRVLELCKNFSIYS